MLAEGSKFYFYTRFAVPVTNGGDRHLDLDWLHRRLELFQEWCLPSVLGQSDSDFEWKIAIDARVDKSFIATLSELLPEQVELRFWDRGGGEGGLFGQLPEGGSLNVTCRLDSDDAIHKDFVRTVRSLARDGYVVNLLRGARIDLGKSRAVPIWDASGPFISFVSSRGQAVNSLGRHAQVSRSAPVINLETANPMWLQTVSGTNILNSVKWFYPPEKRSRLTENFSLPETAIKQISRATSASTGVMTFLTLIPRLVLRTRQVMRAKKIGSYQTSEGGPWKKVFHRVNLGG